MERSDRILVLVAAMTLLLAGSLPVIIQVERDLGYPPGQMCNSIFTGYVDTCRH